MSSQRRDASAAWRLRLVGGLLGLVVFAIGFRLVWLHVVTTETLKGIGDEITIRYETQRAHRGLITDRLGQPLAVSTPVAAVAVRQKRLTDSAWSEQLGLILGMDPERLRARVAESQLPYIYLSRYVTPERADQIDALNLDGIEIVRQFRRFYPAGEVAAHLVGFTNIEDRGQEGLELVFDHWLSGSDGMRHVLKNRRANVVRYVSAGKEVEQGRELRLSIDLRLQYLTYRALKEAVARSRATAGSAVLIDAWTGELLAVAAQPAFNPNDMTSRKPDRVRNRPVSDLMEPGSPIKPFTVATALDVGVVTPDTMVSTSPGRMTIQRKVIRDVRDYGTIDVSTVVKKSSNIGSAKLALMLEPSELRDRLAMLGFGQSSGLGLSGEADGFLPSFSTWRDLDRAVLSYGYGLMVTPLQLAQAYTVFANDGVLRPVTMLVNGQAPKPVRVFKPETIRQMLPMLQAVTEQGGTAVNARIPLYHVGGKTGTTMKLGEDGGYASKRYISSFVGIAPMDRPRFVMAVVIDDPQAQQYYGGQVAAPVFADVMDDVMRLYDVPPDNPADALLAGGRP